MFPKNYSISDFLSKKKKKKNQWKIPNHLPRTDWSVWTWRPGFSGRDEDGEQIQALTTRNS